VADLGAAVFDRVRLTVAPLRYGAGVKGKVLDSLAAGVPCVMTPCAAEGVALPPALQRLVGHDAGELAALILRLHENRNANAAAAKAGLSLIRTVFSADAVTTALRAAVTGATQGAVARQATGAAEATGVAAATGAAQAAGTTEASGTTQNAGSLALAV
jgi:hypothetical protein